MYQLLESWNSKPIGLLPKPENNGKQWVTIEKNLCAKTLRAAPPTPPTFLSFCNCGVNMRSRPDKNHINGSINSDAVRGSEAEGTKTGLEKAGEI